MPTKPTLPKRHHAQYREIEITYKFIWRNPNPPHIWDACDKELEDRIADIARNNDILSDLHHTLKLRPDEGKGLIHPAFVEEGTGLWFKVKARECGLRGKPLSMWERIRYLLTGRYRW